MKRRKPNNTLPSVEPFHSIIQGSFKLNGQDTQPNWNRLRELQHQNLIIFKQFNS